MCTVAHSGAKLESKLSTFGMLNETITYFQDMKRTILYTITTILMMVSISMRSQQTLEYSFTGQYLGGYTPIEGGTTLWSNNFDDQISSAITIPGITFGGMERTTLQICANGWITFGAVANGAAYFPLNNTVNGADGIIAPMAADLKSSEVGGANVSYLIEGEVVTIQWTNVKRYGAAPSTENMSFQVILDTANDGIYFAYNVESVASWNTYPQVGMKVGAAAPGAGQYANRSVTNDNTWMTSIDGDNNASSCRLTSMVPISIPESGLVYSWNGLGGGCTDPGACNYDSEATFNNGSCDYCSCVTTCGCNDPLACNYDLDATADDGSCEYSCYGCTDPEALNYESTATTDNGSCVYAGGGATCAEATSVECGMVMTGSTLGIPGDGYLYPDDACGMQMGSNGQAWFVYLATFNGQVTFSSGNNQTTNFDTQLHVYSGSCGNFLCEGTSDDYQGLQSQVSVNVISGNTYFIRLGGYASAQGDYTFSVTCDNSGCMDALACNYNPDALSDNGSCEYCSCNTCGCMDESACNYNAEATIDNGSCYTAIEVTINGDQIPCIGMESILIAQPTNGYGPYSYNWSDGSTGSNINMIALDMEPVIYTVSISDANGCSGSESITITGFECIWGCLDPQACNYNALANQDDVCDYSCLGCMNPDAMNYSETATIDDGSCYFEGEGNTCMNPIALSCGVGVYENMTVGVINDNATSGAMACSGNSNGGQRWYVYTAAFSSEITVSTINAGTNFDTYLKVFTGSCGDLTCVGQNDDIVGTGFQSQVVFDAVAGETYLIRVGGFVTMQGSFVLTFECGGGCLDEAACNYDPGAPFDDGSCTYGLDCYGCTDPDAENYDPIAVYDQGCQYHPEILVYHDLNGNGIHNTNEPGLSNWPVYIPAMSATIYTDANGFINVNLPASSFQIELINNTENWISSTPDAIMIDVPEDMSGTFGLIPSTGETFFVAGPYDGFWDIIHCTNGYETGVLINNTGSAPLNGVLTMTCDNLFTPEADEYGTVAPDQVAAGFAQWNISDYLAGSSQLFSMHIDGPGVEEIGTTHYFNFNLVLYDGSGNEIYNESWQTSPLIACSYDPNDLTANPVGLYDPHFILPGERIQYRIRFQNTGNLYAEDITIMDDLDPSVFDLTTFQPLYASASMVACLHDDGLVDFIFNDIYLPDSATNEEGSHGFVVYQIEARADLAPNTVLYNQASIFFEQNPAIITNEVYHTIFDCSTFTGIDGDMDLCENELIVLDATQPYVESYVWNVDGDIYNGSSIDLSDLPTGPHNIQLNTSNPLCNADHTNTLTVHPTPTLDAGMDMSVCEGNSLLLNATSNTDVIWSNALANGSEYTPVATETLTVSATSTVGCTVTDDLQITVSPLPSGDVTMAGNALTAASGASWQWYYNDNLLEGETSQTLITNGGGTYYVIITSEDGCSTISQTVMVVGMEDSNAYQVLVYPNPMTDRVTIALPAGMNKITLTDASGRIVYSKENCAGIINLTKTDIASGMYHFMVQQNHFIYTTKLIVN